MDYFDNSSSYCNTTIGPYVYNLTSSYTDKSNEASMVATTVVMFLLAALFFNLNLFSRLSDVSAILNPSVRLFLSTALSLFLPVMSYLFSEAKNAAGAGYSRSPASAGQTEFSLRARLILTWMLLVELLRNKVEAILINAGMLVYSGTIDRAARIAWLGYLVFFNLQSTGRKAVFGILWVLSAAKLVQRVVIAELGKRSFAYGKNAQLLTSYMLQMLEQERHVGWDEEHPSNLRDGSELLRRCNYAVMGEEILVKEADPHGYHLEVKKVTDDTVVTVGKIWTTLSMESDLLSDSDGRLRRLCLSYALFNLLRRRFEDLPMTETETRNCQDLIFKGLCREDTNRQVAAITLFQVMHNEVNFLSEYYHSIHPVVFANPFFFVVNYFLFPIVVWFLCLMTIILCGNGDASYAFHSIGSDNVAISVGVTTMMRCLASQVLKSPSAFFSTVDLSITGLLFLTFFYEEVWEFLVFRLSNWFVVSLLCDYTAKPHWRDSPTFRGAIRRILWVRTKLGYRHLSIKQFSVLSFCRLSVTLPNVAVPKEAKLSIMESLAAYGGDTAPLSKGKSAVARYNPQLLWACESESIAEVILTWHVATSLLEMEYPEQNVTPVSSDRKVATRLSKYCAYLAAFHLELLPDNRDCTKRVNKALKEELKKLLGCWGYYFWPETTRYEKITQIDVPREPLQRSVLQSGVKLWKMLRDEAKGNEGRVWKLLAELWTELIVYTAPSSDEVHVKGHEQALAQGGEFITMLWALATHTGITRPAVAPPRGHSDEHIHG